MSETFVKNPETGRPVKVGGRIWTRLVKKGIISDDGYKDPNILCESAPDNPKLKITEINQSLPPEIEAVRGRGKYANKIVKRNKSVRRKPIVIRQQSRDSASALSRDSASALSDTESSSDDDDLKDMILNELARSVHRSKPIKIPKKKKVHQPVYPQSDTDYTEITTTCADDDESESE